VKAPTRRLFGLTWVGWLNYLLLRWFFVRLSYEVPEAPTLRFVTSAPKSGIATVQLDLAPPTRWFLLRWISPVPWSDMQYIGGRRARARDLDRRQSPIDREAQAMDFAYGNLAASTNHMPTREAFAALAAKRGWSPEAFEVWAAGREWRTP
jgi:hypothetical protein